MASYAWMDQFKGHPYERLIKRLLRDQWWVKYRNIPYELMRTKLKGERMPYGYETVPFPVFDDAELERWHIFDVLSLMTGDRILRNHCHWSMNVLVVQAMDREAFAGLELAAHPIPNDLTFEGYRSGDDTKLVWGLRDIPLYQTLFNS